MLGFLKDSDFGQGSAHSVGGPATHVEYMCSSGLLRSDRKNDCREQSRSPRVEKPITFGVSEIDKAL